MGAAGFFLEDGAAADVRARCHVRPGQEDGVLGEAALELDPGAELAVLDRHGGFVAEHAPGGDDRATATNPTSGANDDTVTADVVDVDVVVNVDGQRIGDAHPPVDELGRFLQATRLQRRGVDVHRWSFRVAVRTDQRSQSC